MMDLTAGWTEDWGNTWTRTEPGKPGRPDLLLRVFPDPDSKEEPWTWEVLTLEEDVEREVAVGGGVTREAAMAAAIVAAYGE
jgi:hypothetical protein